MPSQYLTIAKIGGSAAAETHHRFQAWSAARTVDDASEWDPNQWPEVVRNSADAWAEGLREHGHEPPVIFFAEYADLWSFCPAPRFLGDTGFMPMYANRYELFCVPLPLATSVAKELSKMSRRGQYDEDHFFADITLRAARAWSEIVRDAVVVILRRVVGGLVADHEVITSLKGLPDWMIGA